MPRVGCRGTFAAYALLAPLPTAMLPTAMLPTPLLPALGIRLCLAAFALLARACRCCLLLALAHALFAPAAILLLYASRLCSSPHTPSCTYATRTHAHTPRSTLAIQLPSIGHILSGASRGFTLHQGRPAALRALSLRLRDLRGDVRTRRVPQCAGAAAHR